MLTVSARLLTVYDYFLLPETGPRYQLVEGELHRSPAPDRVHQETILNIAYVIRRYLEQHPVGKVFVSPLDVTLTDLNVFQPDVIFVTQAHAAILTPHGAEGAPDLVVEILSPKTAALDKGLKRETYARTGVQELWLIDPSLKRLMVYRLQENAETPLATYDEAATFSTPLLPGFTIHTRDIFRA